MNHKDFDVTTRRDGGKVFLHAAGYLSREGGARLEAEVERLLGEGVRGFVVNFRGTELVTSVGVAVLIGVIERVRAQGGEVSFSELTRVNEEIFRIMGLDRFARIVASDADAPGA